MTHSDSTWVTYTLRPMMVRNIVKSQLDSKVHIHTDANPLASPATDQNTLIDSPAYLHIASKTCGFSQRGGGFNDIRVQIWKVHTTHATCGGIRPGHAHRRRQAV